MPSHIRSSVLFVDDDQDACEVLSVLMRAYGVDITCAQSAAEAWPLMKANRFDLYMLDGWLPKLDGFEFCRQIRESDSSTPILFYSGAAYEADKQKGIEAGANAYVVKPDIDGLIDNIRNLLAKPERKKLTLPATLASPAQLRMSSPLFLNLTTTSS